MNRAGITIETWDQSHPRWAELWHVVAGEGQVSWCEFNAGWHLSSTILVALRDGEVAGFLRFVVQGIGIEEDHEPVQLAGQVLTEAKILAFGVVSALRGQGIGRVLQMAAVQAASALGCYQVRSHSSGGNKANHHLKLSMGFGVQPIVRGEDQGGVYFILPLRGNKRIFLNRL
jgi:GNAT superfamily N-acetyltransferase